MKRNLLIYAIILSLLAPLSLSLTHAAAPQQRRRAAARPAASAPAPARQPQAQLVNRVLANGLEIIVLEDHSVPLVTIELAVKNGSYTEPPELNGLSHLYEHMFFKANRAIANKEEYLQKIGQLGIAYNGSTREEVVNYYFTTTSPNLRTAMNFMRDAARYPLFDQNEFEREREVVIGEYDRAESNPFWQLQTAMGKKLWGEQWSRKNTIGDRQTILSTTPAKMRAIQQRYYVPNNTALIVTGDVNPDSVFRWARAALADWPRGEDP
ncbi:MAG TPA: pitrilysin family protein, partial [Pyrinomonadaceae bacterium]|nr:pitrilysin family protein [Pyrinomonadaceae bacterium]